MLRQIDLVPSSSPAHPPLTLYNASNTPGSVKIMLIVAPVGMPLVSTYTVAIYRMFRGKVRLNRRLIQRLRPGERQRVGR